MIFVHKLSLIMHKLPYDHITWQFFFCRKQVYIHVGEKRALTQLYVMSYSKVIGNSVYFLHQKTLQKCHFWDNFWHKLYKEIVSKVGLYFQLQMVIKSWIFIRFWKTTPFWKWDIKTFQIMYDLSCLNKITKMTWDPYI